MGAVQHVVVRGKHTLVVILGNGPRSVEMSEDMSDPPRACTDLVFTVAKVMNFVGRSGLRREKPARSIKAVRMAEHEPDEREVLPVTVKCAQCRELT